MSRAQSPIRVVLWFIATLVTIWVATLIFGYFLEPLADIAGNMQAVQNSAYSGHIDIYLTATMWGFILLGVGAMALIVIFAVWREGFLGQRRRPR